MPKMKTHRGTAKRVKITGTGKIKRHHAFASHILGKMTAKRKRNLRQATLMDDTQRQQMKKLLPYA